MRKQRGTANASRRAESRKSIVWRLQQNLMALDHAAQGIRVNALSPGAVEPQRLLVRKKTMETARVASVPLHPIGRLGERDEIAATALFLASDAPAQ
ncbi:MAG: SDR family oxidoreductase [Janthinobacterium lividum]